MKRSFPYILAAAFSTLTGYAELTEHPDANTLWRLGTGTPRTAASASIGVWDTSDVAVSAHPSGGLILKNDNPSAKAGHTARIQVPADKDYPYLVFELPEINPFKGYRTWGVSTRELQGGFSQVTHAKPGLVVLNLEENQTVPFPKVLTLNVYVFDFELYFKELKMVKKPDYFISVESRAFQTKKKFAPGDKLCFTVYLKESAEDVTIRFISPNWLYNLTFNNCGQWQLKPVDESQKVWRVEFSVESLKGAHKMADINRRGSILIQATVLGGALNSPLWGIINYPYDGKKE